jgi:hypothetical protein
MVTSGFLVGAATGPLIEFTIARKLDAVKWESLLDRAFP